MSVTRTNLQRTFQELNAIDAYLNEARTLVITPNAGSARQMSAAELEFALRNATNALITLSNAFQRFLTRIDIDSRQQR